MLCQWSRGKKNTMLSAAMCYCVWSTFSHRTLFARQSLLLAVGLDGHSLERQGRTRFHSVLQTMNVAPEQLEEQLPLLDVLRKGERMRLLEKEIIFFKAQKRAIAEHQ